MTAEAAEHRPAWAPTWPTIAGITGSAIVAGSLGPYTWPMRAATTAACIVVAFDAVRHGWLQRGDSPAGRHTVGTSGAAVAVWLALIGSLLLVQLALYLSAPRTAYPTLSSLASIAFDLPLVRMGGFALWLWVGWYLVRR